MIGEQVYCLAVPSGGVLGSSHPCLRCVVETECESEQSDQCTATESGSQTDACCSHSLSVTTVVPVIIVPILQCEKISGSKCVFHSVSFRYGLPDRSTKMITINPQTKGFGGC